jgi:uncharacterized protein (TIGR02231 family)
MWRASSVGFSFLFQIAAAQAGAVEAGSAIESVVVHPDAATVTRRLVVDVAPGAQTIIVQNLPFGIDPDSLRVAGEADGRVEIGAVETRFSPADVRGADSAIETRLRQLRIAREQLQTAIDALAAKQAMILRFAQAGSDKGAEGRALALGDWNIAFDTVGAALARNGEELRAKRAEAKELDEKIHALDQGEQRAARRPVREATIAVEAASAAKLRLTVSYLVAGASWRPVYDARLETGGKDGKPRLEILRRASVSQTTGEDWSEAALRVSTTRAQGGASAPEVQPQRVSFFEPPMPLAARRMSHAESDVARKRVEAPMEAAAPAAAPESAPVEQQVASLDAGAYQANFKIAGRVSVPSDGSAKSFTLSSHVVEPALSARVAPGIDPTAYLEARFVNEEDAPLLPGLVTVSRDGARVGQSRIGLVAPGDALDLGFGADDRVKVARAPVKRVENEPSFFGQTRYETRDVKTTLKNLHDFPIRITVVDRIPYSESTAITVEILPQTTPPSVKQLGDKRGVMAWTFDAQPGDTKDLRLAYRVKWPADREIVTEPAFR